MSDVVCRRYSCACSLLIAAFAIVLAGAPARAQQRTPFQHAWDSGTPVTLVGELTVLYADDFENRRSELIHMVRDDRTGKEYRLRFEQGAPAGLRSGSRVTARGRLVTATVYLAADGTGFSVDSAALVTQQAAAVTGDQKTLVIVADFTDRSVNPSIWGADCSVGAIRDRMFTDPLGYSVDGLYRETSAGKVSFTGKVVGPYTINFASTDVCDLQAWTLAAEAQAAANGADLAAYQRKVYVLPEANCGAAGIGQLGVSPSRAWVFACDSPRVYGHELGHNLGLHHASTSTYEYGDESDIMGIPSKLKPFNAPHKMQLGWVPESHVAAITSDGRYDIAPLALDAGAATDPQVLTISVPDSPDAYYVSYRSGASGFEANVTVPYANSINVHRWAGGTNMTYLLATLVDGATYVDPATGFTVTQETQNGVFATARIELGTGCGRAAPTLSLSPREQSGSPGSTVNFDVVLTNNDAPACPDSSFALQRAVPSGWTGSLSVATLQLAAGTAGSARLAVTAPTGVAPGAYSVGITVSDGGTGSGNPSSSGTFTVTADDTIPPTVPGLLVAKLKGRDVNLTWLTATDNVRVAGYRVSRNGVTIATTTGPGWTDATAAAGTTYTYQVVAADPSGNVSAPSNSVTLQMATAGRKGR